MKPVMQIQTLCSVIFIGLVSACSTPAKPPAKPAPTTQHDHTAYSKTEVVNTLPAQQPGKTLREQLFDHHAEWQGTKYRLGGTSKDGIDCSGFVQLTYRKLFQIHTPRTTLKLSATGLLVDKTQLEVGDLVFFKYSRSFRHVGIYLGNQQFLHASTSKGVTISSLNTVYWQQRYWKARRIL